MILVAGGTGRLGTALVGRLVERGELVRVLTRDPPRASHLPASVERVVGDVRDVATLAPAVSGADSVVSAVHGFVGGDHVSPATVDRDGALIGVDRLRRLAELGVGAALEAERFTRAGTHEACG